jgi:cytochrome P450
VARLRTLFAYNRDPFRTLVDLTRDYGDVVRFIAGSVNAFLLNGPDNVEAVLVRDAWSFVPMRPFTVKRAMGEGLFTSHGYVHQHQRQLLQDAYAPEHVARFGGVITAWGARFRDTWRDGAEMDLEGQLERLVVYISAEILFGDAIRSGWKDLVQPAVPVNEYLGTRSTNPLSAIPEALPLRSDNRRFWRALRRLERGIDRLIRERRAMAGRAEHAPGADGGDFLSHLLRARDASGQAMGQRQIRDEVIANYTTGNGVLVSGLLWTWYLLAQHPAVEARLHAELDSVLGGMLPTVDDLPRLPYARMVVAESLRLYPPAWVIGRRVVQDYPLAGVVLPARSMLLVSPYVMQRDPRYFPDPDRFDPERWTPEATAARPAFSFFPFSAGPRSCLGEHLAWTEMLLLLATLAQRWRLRLVPGYPLELLPLISLRPRYGMRMRAEARADAP